MKEVAFTMNKIIPILEETEDYIAGFDIITDKYYRIKKSACLISPKWVENILKDKDLQIQISNNFRDSTFDRAEFLGISQRTYIRFNNELKVDE